MYSDENKSSVLAKFLNGFDYVIIDTCSLMDDAFPEWMDALHGAKAYRKKGLEILVPRRCFDELKKHARQKENDSRRIDAKRGLKILRRARWSKLLTVTKKDKNENFADNWIYVKVSTDRLFSRILIITQDKSLAYDLRALNELKSQNGRPIEVSKIVTGGRLVPNFGEQSPRKEHRGSGFLAKDNPKQQKPKEPNPAEAVLLADARLSAVINNPNYPSDRKKADAVAQIKAIEKMPESLRSRLDLLVPMPKLKELAKATKKAEPAPKKEEAPAPKVEASEEPKAPVKEKLWYGVGKTMAEGFQDCAKHYGMLFHEPSVNYFKDAHGPLDLTTVDLENIEALGMSLLHGEDKISFLYRGMTLMTLKTPEKFKCWIDVNALPKNLLPLSKTDAPKAKTKEEPKEADKPKAESPAKEEKPKAASSKKKVTPKKAEEPKAEEAKPAPAEKPAKAPAKKKVKAEPAESAVTEAPKPKKAAKPKNSPQKADEKTVEAVDKPVKEEPKPKAKATPKKASSKKPTAKKEDKPEQPKDANYQRALTAERRLRAVLPNPNYPTEDKIKDLNAQKELLASLTKEQRDTLKLGPEQIDEWIKTHE